MMNVPYRYNKEFLHRVRSNNKIKWKNTIYLFYIKLLDFKR